MLAALQLAMILGAAVLLVYAANPGAAPSSRAFAAVATLALALGLCGLSHLVWLLIAAPAVELQWLTDLLLFGGAVALWRRRRHSGSNDARVAPELPEGRSGLVLATLATAVLASAAVAILVAMRAAPHGDWDAWAIWNLRARFLFRGAAHWIDALQPEIVHSNYPLLLPLIVARGWSLLGHDTTFVPRAVSFLGSGLALAFLIVTLKRLRGLVPACLAVLATLSLSSPGSHLPLLLGHAASQLADVPLACFLLASLCCAAISLINHEISPPSLALAGAFAGLAAWTKNEGKLFALALVVALALVTAVRHGRRAALERTGALLSGLLPGAVLLWIISATFGRIPAGFFTQSVSVILDKATSWDRHRQIVTSVIEFLSRPERLPVLLLLALYAAMAGCTRRQGAREAAATIGATLAAVVAGYYVIYAISPYDLAWHLQYSLDRLFVQLWPGVVLLVFLAARTPAEVALAASCARPSQNASFAAGAPER